MKFLSAIFLIPLMININAFAGSSIPPVGQPLPSTLDSKWKVYSNVKYENGKLIECKSELILGPVKCSKSFTLQEILDLEFGKGYTPTAISPFVGSLGNELGIVLYYKKNEVINSNKK